MKKVLVFTALMLLLLSTSLTYTSSALSGNLEFTNQDISTPFSNSTVQKVIWFDTHGTLYRNTSDEIKINIKVGQSILPIKLTITFLRERLFYDNVITVWKSNKSILSFNQVITGGLSLTTQFNKLFSWIPENTSPLQGKHSTKSLDQISISLSSYSETWNQSAQISYNFEIGQRTYVYSRLEPIIIHNYLTQNVEKSTSTSSIFVPILSLPLFIALTIMVLILRRRRI